MKKLIKLILVIGTLVFTGCVGENNKIPDELLGTYIQDGVEQAYNPREDKHVDYYKNQGIAKLYKKGSRYYIEVDSKYIIGDEVVRTYNLQANGKIKEVQYQELAKQYGVHGNYAKDIYNIIFTDLKTSGKDGDELKYDPRITLVGERKLKTKEENINDYNSYNTDFKYEVNPISVLWIKGKKFKKVKE